MTRNTTPKTTPKNWLTINAAAERMGVSPRALRRRIEKALASKRGRVRMGKNGLEVDLDGLHARQWGTTPRSRWLVDLGDWS